MDPEILAEVKVLNDCRFKKRNHEGVSTGRKQFESMMKGSWSVGRGTHATEGGWT